MIVLKLFIAVRIINLHDKAGSFIEMKKINTPQLSDYIGEYPNFKDERILDSASVVPMKLKQNNEAISNFFETASL
jgi:hypothetical protein